MSKVVLRLHGTHGLCSLLVVCAANVSIDWSASNGAIASCGADDSLVILSEDPSSRPEEPSFSKEVVASHAHFGDVNCVRWHPTDAGILATAGDDCVVRVWKYAASGSDTSM